MKDWANALKEALSAQAYAPAHQQGYLSANCEMIGRAISGQGPDDDAPVAGAGAHVVVNISATHVPALCDTKQSPYKNYYDRGKHRVGEGEPKSRRQIVDESLPVDGPGTETYKHVYFGAVEVNGSGVRFYGDFCLVLRDSSVPPQMVILDRNSYDLLRLPLSASIADDADRRRVAESLAGAWGADLKYMAALKLYDRFSNRMRRLTAGEISDAVLSDEDYIEALWIRKKCDGTFESFNIDDLLEVRLSAADVALEEHIGYRAASGSAPRIEELVWRATRRDAERALSRVRVRTRVITMTGRQRS